MDIEENMSASGIPDLILMYLQFRIYKCPAKRSFATAFWTDNMTTVYVTTRLFLREVQLLLPCDSNCSCWTLFIVQIVAKVCHVL